MKLYTKYMISTKLSKRIFVAISDLIILIFSLYLSLSIRNLNIEEFNDFLNVLYPFFIIIFTNIIIFYIYGLYDRMTTKIYKELSNRIITAQILSSVIASIIFYSSNYFVIAPKTILLIYIIVSSVLIFFWRKYARKLIKSNKNYSILLVAKGKELNLLKEELKENKILNIKKIETFDLEENKDLDIYTKIKTKLKNENFDILAINLYHPHIKPSVQLFYELLLDKIEVLNFSTLYEEIMQKIPLENIDAGWFFNNFNQKDGRFYSFIKRILDLLISIPSFIISIPFYIFVFFGIKLQDGENIFYLSKRIGKDNKEFILYKFRSMKNTKSEEERVRITSFGKFIRSTRIDELPQLINIIKGDMTLIGPRPETPTLFKEYSNQISFYGIRQSIKPGLSGYAQIYQEQNIVPKFGLEINATKDKLSYDIYYLKHRSLFMDISLILKTIKNIISKTGV